MAINNIPLIPCFNRYDLFEYINKESVSQIKAPGPGINIQSYKQQLINRLTTRYLEEVVDKNTEKK